jgi:signal transduction histidine kinase
MSLTTRLVGFSLAALAVVLVGFSALVLLLAQADVDRHVDRRVQGTLDAMAAAVEVKPNGLEWEPDQRGFALSSVPGDAPVAWLVYADGKLLVSRGAPLRTAELERGFPGDSSPRPLADWRDRKHRSWRVELRRIKIPESSGPSAPVRHRRKKATILLVAGICQSDANAPLYRLAGMLAVASVLVWVVMALLARRMCRLALAPVRRMTEAVRRLGTATLSDRLPEPGTRDEIADLARSFNDLLGRVEESFERQRAFTSEASHQFRTPLAGILAQTAVALRSPRSAEEHQRTLRLIHDRTDDLRKMVEALLFLARADAEASIPELQDLDLAEWLPAHLSEWSDVRLSAPSSPAVVRAHPVLLGQLLDNLLDNAIKYGSSPVKVTLRLQEGEIGCEVADQGPGIPADDLPRLFDPFYRTNAARLLGVAGAGLGLAISRRLAQSLRGRLTVESEPGQGSRFTLWLPIVKTN